MKAIEYLKREREIKKHCADVAWGYYDKSIDEAIRLYDKLSEGGNIEIPIADNPEESCFAMFRDKFGIEWMINFDKN